MKRFSFIGVMVVSMFVLMACGEQQQDQPTEALGEMFEFYELEITIGDDISWGRINAYWTENEGVYYFYLPVTFTNIGETSDGLSRWDFDIFGPNGISLEEIDWYVDGPSIETSRDVRPGMTMETYLHILFDGDGEYIIELHGMYTMTSITFNVSR